MDLGEYSSKQIGRITLGLMMELAGHECGLGSTRAQELCLKLNALAAAVLQRADKQQAVGQQQEEVEQQEGSSAPQEEGGVGSSTPQQLQQLMQLVSTEVEARMLGLLPNGYICDTIGELPASKAHITPWLLRGEECRDLVQLFKQDVRGFGTDMLERVLPDIVHHATLVEGLSYNPVLGKIWRAACALRGDPRRQALVDNMAATISR